MPSISIIAGGLGAIVLVALMVSGLVFFLHRHLNGRRRVRAFAAVYAALFLTSLAQGLLSEVGDASRGMLPELAGVAMVALSSIGTAALAFFAGREFTLLPKVAGEAAPIAWLSEHPQLFALHALFELLSVIALALTAEFVITIFSDASARLRIRQGAFGDIVVINATGAMVPHAHSFSESLAARPQPAAIFSMETGPSSGETLYRLSVGNISSSLDHETFLRCLSDAVRRRRPGLRCGPARELPERCLSILSFRNGRVTVATYPSAEFDEDGAHDLLALIDDPNPPETGRPRTHRTHQADVCSYSVEELKVRQLMRALLPSGQAQNRGFELGLKPLNALLVGNDVERLVLLVVYLVRNGQAVIPAPENSIEPRRPRISIASAQEARVERRLRRAYPSLFPVTDGAGAEGSPLLTPPVKLAFFESKFEMFESVPLSADELTVVADVEPDTGRAPSRREVWHRCLQRRCPGIDPLFLQYDCYERPGLVYEDPYGGREAEKGDGFKRVLIFGSSAACMRDEALLRHALDRRAMLVNLRYATGARPDLFDDAASEPFLDDAVRHWTACTPYDHESSRAAADFVAVESLLWQKGNERRLEAERLRCTVGHLEHLRWSAYMVTSGYISRPWDTLADDFVRAVSEQDAADGEGARRILKELLRDTRLQRHAALVDWHRLPEADRSIAALADDPRARAILEDAGCLDEFLARRSYQESDCAIIDDLLS